MYQTTHAQLSTLMHSSAHSCTAQHTHAQLSILMHSSAHSCTAQHTHAQLSTLMHSSAYSCTAQHTECCTQVWCSCSKKTAVQKTLAKVLLRLKLFLRSRCIVGYRSVAVAMVNLHRTAAMKELVEILRVNFLPPAAELSIPIARQGIEQIFVFNHQ